MIFPSLNPAEINTARNHLIHAVLPIPCDRVITRILQSILEYGDSAAMDVVDLYQHIALLRDTVSNHRLRIERIGIVTTKATK